MLKTFVLAAIASLLFASQAGAESSVTPQKLNAILCETEDQAVALASSMTSGETEPMAINAVNKAAGAEVCGRYIGYAVVEIEKRRTLTAPCSCLQGFASPKTIGSPGRRAGSRPSTAWALRAALRANFGGSRVPEIWAIRIGTWSSRCQKSTRCCIAALSGPDYSA